MINLVIIGAGGFGRETAEIVKSLNENGSEIDLIGFLDDDQALHGKIVNNIKVLGNLEYIRDSNLKDIHFVCAIGDTIIKRKVVEKALNYGYIPYSLISPDAKLYNNIKIGDGVIICPGTILTTNIQVGNYAIINQICSIGHEAIIGEFSTINPLSAISGGVVLEEGVFVGTCVSVLQYIKIGKWAIIGSGASVIKDIPELAVAVGVPAKIIKKRQIQ